MMEGRVGFMGCKGEQAVSLREPEFSHRSRASDTASPALSLGTRGFYHEGSRESRYLLFIFVNGPGSSSCHS